MEIRRVEGSNPIWSLDFFSEFPLFPFDAKTYLSLFLTYF